MTQPDRDEQKLAELGYKQDLTRVWSSFSNFAISFTIISVLAGCFTTYGQAWNNGGPVAISWGWPIIGGLILIIAFCMSELVSAYPTAGGPYWWAAKLGGPGWAWFTGWFNVIGLLAVVASVDYAAATFGSTLFNLWGLDLGVINFADGASLGEIFWVFVALLFVHALINIYSSHLVALFNNISVFWHVAGVAVIIAILVFVPDRHQSLDFVFTETHEQLRVRRRHVLVVRAAARLPADACTRSPATTHRRTSPRRRTRRRWRPPRASGRSVFYSVAHRLVRAAGDHVRRHRHRRDRRVVRLLAGDLHERDERGLGRDGDPHIVHRAVLLRHGVRDELLAHVLRVLARPRRARLAAVDAAQQQARAGLVGLRRLRARADHDAAGAVERRRRRHPDRVLRRRVDRGHRPLHRLRDAGLPAPAGG